MRCWAKTRRPSTSNAIGKHLTTRSWFGDRLIDSGQQWLNILSGKVPVNGAETSSSPTILVLQPGPNRFIQCVAVDAVERTAEHSVPFEQGEGQISLLHTAWVLLTLSDLRQQFQQPRNHRLSRWSDFGECLSRIDAEPEVFVVETFLQWTLSLTYPLDQACSGPGKHRSEPRYRVRRAV